MIITSVTVVHYLSHWAHQVLSELLSDNYTRRFASGSRFHPLYGVPIITKKKNFSYFCRVGKGGKKVKVCGILYQGKGGVGVEKVPAYVAPWSLFDQLASGVTGSPVPRKTNCAGYCQGHVVVGQKGGGHRALERGQFRNIFFVNFIAFLH